MGVMIGYGSESAVVDCRGWGRGCWRREFERAGLKDGMERFRG